MFENIKEEATRKFCELKLWVANIDITNDYNVITRGLFFVYVYGIYEEIIREVVSFTIDEINQADLKVSECIYELYPLLFSEEYDSLYNVGNEHKWEKRWKISEKLKQDATVNISHDLMPTDGKNIRYRQLYSIARSFGMNENILSKNEVGGYIQEMVDNRNYIAHGNKTPQEVGRNYTIRDLQRRCEIIAEVCTYIISIYENYIMEKRYLKIENIDQTFNG